MSVEYSLIKKLIKYNSADYQAIGICYHLNRGEKYLFLSTCKYWHCVSEAVAHPVPVYLGCKDKHLAIEAYYRHDNKVGNHEYGKARRALIKSVMELLEPNLNSWEQFKLKVYKKWRNYE